MFITRRPLGLIATPGTYLSVEAYSEYVETRIVSHSVVSSSDIIVYHPSSALDIREYDFRSRKILKYIQAEVKEFAPDVVCIGCFAPEKKLSLKKGWSDVARSVKAVSPSSKIILEVKSPLLMSGLKLKRVQEEMASGQSSLDAIIAPAIGMVETWLPIIEVPFLQHRSILDFNKIKRRAVQSEIQPCRKIIFSGSLEKRRKIGELLKLIANLQANHREALVFDFYGDGAAKSDLIELAKELGLQDVVSFKGALLQRELFNIYCLYDAGLAWVPKEKYDSAPSLKLYEYCAAGLIPIATNTKGHNLLKEFGFEFEVFDENKDSFLSVLVRISKDGFPSTSLNNNLEIAQKSDYRVVIRDEILPFYETVVNAKHQCSSKPEGAEVIDLLSNTKFISNFDVENARSIFFRCCFEIPRIHFKKLKRIIRSLLLGRP